MLRVLDRNFNLALAPGGADVATSELWRLLAKCPAVLKPKRVADGASIQVKVSRTPYSPQSCCNRVNPMPTVSCWLAYVEHPRKFRNLQP